ncbi:unnamed protein product [Coffea canephora]|uniref:Amino acid transporter transmembrane domain-containing protein n=1 Tax=Coffea canephora TaxID=49390 RepID=A0A068ULG8_COFCA|nr:unnamed protein product [Coffea canephora]
MEIILILAVILMIMRTKGRRANLSPPLGLKVTGSPSIYTVVYHLQVLTSWGRLRRPSLRKATADKKSSKVSHEVSLPSQSSYGQAVVNGINVLCGVGILSTTCAVKEGGWVGLSILFIFAVVSYYTGILLHSCLDSQPGLETYPDIGHAAFGNVGCIVSFEELQDLQHSHLDNLYCGILEER